MKSRFNSEQEANEYKQAHQLVGRVAEPISATGKWALNFPLSAHLTVLDSGGMAVEGRSRHGTDQSEHPGMTSAVNVSPADGEVLGRDADGGVVQWDATAEAPYNSGQQPHEFGLETLSSDELKRLSMPARADPQEFLLAEYGRYAQDVAEGDPMQFDDWLAGSDLQEIIMARGLLAATERSVTTLNDRSAGMRALLSGLVEYAERFADVNSEPESGACREAVRKGHAWLAGRSGEVSIKDLALELGEYVAKYVDVNGEPMEGTCRRLLASLEQAYKTGTGQTKDATGPALGTEYAQVNLTLNMAFSNGVPNGLGGLLDWINARLNPEGADAMVKISKPTGLLCWPDFLDAPGFGPEHPDHPAAIRDLQKVESWLEMDREALIHELLSQHHLIEQRASLHMADGKPTDPTLHGEVISTTSLDHTVRFEVSVTATSPQEAAQFALEDLRDTSLGPWLVDVVHSGGVARGIATCQLDVDESYPRPAM